MKTLNITITFTHTDPIERHNLLHEVEEIANEHGAYVEYEDEY